jgi:hypothetical protein
MQPGRHRLVGTDAPITVVTLGPEVQRLAGHHDLKPVSLVGQCEVPYEPNAGPSGGRHRLAKLLIEKSRQLREHVVPLAVETA